MSFEFFKKKTCTEDAVHKAECEVDNLYREVAAHEVVSHEDQEKIDHTIARAKLIREKEKRKQQAEELRRQDSGTA